MLINIRCTEARKMADHQFIDRPMGIQGLFFFKGLLNFLTKEETLTQVRWLLTSEVNNYLFITDYFQYKIGIVAFQLALAMNIGVLPYHTKHLSSRVIYADEFCGQMFLNIVFKSNQILFKKNIKSVSMFQTEKKRPRDCLSSNKLIFVVSDCYNQKILRK